MIILFSAPGRKTKPLLDWATFIYTFIHLSFVYSLCFVDVTLRRTECNEKPISCFWHQTLNTLVPPEVSFTFILLSRCGPRPRTGLNCFSWPFWGSLIKRHADSAKQPLLWLELWFENVLLLLQMLLSQKNSIITSLAAPFHRAEESGDTGGIGGWLWLMASH